MIKKALSGTSFDLERSARLRQPEVSIAIKQLKESEWIDEREEKKPGKGRPYKIYSLKIRFNDLSLSLKRSRRKQFMLLRKN